MDTNNNTPRNTPNSDTSKGSIVERRRVGSRKQYNGQMISVSGVTKFNCDGQGWMTFWASVGAKYALIVEYYLSASADDLVIISYTTCMFTFSLKCSVSKSEKLTL